MLDPRNFFAPYIGPPGLQIMVDGGVLLISGGGVVVSSGAITLPSNSTNYVYLNTSSGVVTSNTSGFPSTNCYSIATVITGTSGVTSLVDNRPDVIGQGGGVGGNFTAGVSGTNTLGTSGTVSNAFVIAGGNNITLSASTAVGGMTATIIGVASQTVQTQNLHDLTLGGNTAGVLALISSGTAFLAGGNNITLSQNGQSISIVGGAGGGGFTAGVTGGNTSATSGTAGSSFFLAGGNNITLSGSTGAGILNVTIVGPTTAAQTAQTMGIYNSSQTFGQSSFSTYDARSLSMVGQGIVSLGQTNGSYVISASQSNQTLGLFASSNSTISTTGTANATGLTFVGMGVASVGISAGSVLISVPAGGGGGGSQTVGMSNLGNTSGTSGVASGSAVQFLLVGGNNITLSQSVNGASATISISQNEITFSKYFWPPVQLYSAQSSSSHANTGGLSLQYCPMYNWATMTRVDFIACIMQLGSSAGASTAAIGLSAGLVIYTLTGQTLSPIVGALASSTITWASNTANYSNVSGFRNMSFAIATLMSPGEYYAGLWYSTSSGLSVGTATVGNNATFANFYQNPEFYSSGVYDFNSSQNPASNFILMGCFTSNFTATSQTLQLSQGTFTGTNWARANIPFVFRNY